MKKEENMEISQKAKDIIEKIKEVTASTAYKMTISREKKPGLYDSKFGGVPYWDLEKPYPVDENGEKMLLLAQINFTKAALQEELLPQQGMLQFFISTDEEDWSYGADFEEGDNQKNFRVIYHEEICETYEEEQILSLEIPVSTQLKDSDCSPVTGEFLVEITPQTVWMGTEDYRFSQIFSKAVAEVTGEEIEECNYWDYLGDEDAECFYEVLSNGGHWLLGYPFFTQGDPREGQENVYYDTLLFQMDSEFFDGEGEWEIIWGDAGVANFFINQEDLKKKDFSKVWYTWDCT